MMNNTLKVAIADQYALSAKSLAALLSQYAEVQLLGDVRSCEELFLFLEKTPVDIVLIDLINSDHAKLAICKKIAVFFPETRMIALSSTYDRQTARHLKDYGVEGYLTKNLEPANFMEEVLKVAKLGSSKPLTIEIKHKGAHENIRSHYKISIREIEVISLIAKGLTSTEIADKLCISLNTIKQHRKHILQKLQLKNVQEVVAFSINNGI